MGNCSSCCEPVNEAKEPVIDPEVETELVQEVPEAVIPETVEEVPHVKPQEKPKMPQRKEKEVKKKAHERAAVELRQTTESDLVNYRDYCGAYLILDNNNFYYQWSCLPIKQTFLLLRVNGEINAQQKRKLLKQEKEILTEGKNFSFGQIKKALESVYVFSLKKLANVELIILDDKYLAEFSDYKTIKVLTFNNEQISLVKKHQPLWVSNYDAIIFTTIEITPDVLGGKYSYRALVQQFDGPQGLVCGKTALSKNPVDPKPNFDPEPFIPIEENDVVKNADIVNRTKDIENN